METAIVYWENRKEHVNYNLGFRVSALDLRSLVVRPEA